MRGTRQHVMILTEICDCAVSYWEGLAFRSRTIDQVSFLKLFVGLPFQDILAFYLKISLFFTFIPIALFAN
jgi:hypothetical protein